MKFATWTKDRGALKEASSGGIFFELAKEIVSQGGQIAGVIMHGMKLKWYVTDDLDEIKRMRGSKYIWANPLPAYQKIASTPSRSTLFVGLPCQVAGLKRYLRLKGIADNNVTYVSLRCHGVINTKIFQDYIRWIERITKIKITNIKFRDKTNGWKGAGFSFTYRRNNK